MPNLLWCFDRIEVAGGTSKYECDTKVSRKVRIASRRDIEKIKAPNTDIFVEYTLLDEVGHVSQSDCTVRRGECQDFR